MRVLITGGAGFIGSHLVDRHVAAGDEVVVIDDLSTGTAANLAHHPAGAVRLVEGRVENPKVLDAAWHEIDRVYHLAAAVGVFEILKRPLDALQSNLQATEAIFERAAAEGVRTVFTSTSEVYGKNIGDALSETDDSIFGPTSVSRWLYGVSKATDEFLAIAHHRESGFPATVVRLFNTIGPRQSAAYGMVVPRFVRQALAGDAITIFGDGTQTRCFTDVFDVVEAFVRIAVAPAAYGQVVNIGQPEEISIRGLAELIRAITDSRSPLEYVDYVEAYGPGFEDMRRRVPDVSRLRAFTGFVPDTPLEHTVRQIVSWVQAIDGARPVAPAPVWAGELGVRVARRRPTVDARAASHQILAPRPHEHVGSITMTAQRPPTTATHPDGLQRIVVVGLGFAGLPTAVAIAEAGLETVGLDIDSDKVARISAGTAVSGIGGDLLGRLVGQGLLQATTDTSVIGNADIVVISVPTPIDDAGRPNERILSVACQTVIKNLSRGSLVVLQSTVVPGTTRRQLVRPLEASGLVVGRDVFVSFSPERINPGDPIFHVSNTTKLVAGATEDCLDRGRSFVESFVGSVQTVPALEVAELAKLVENTFRFINISFVNEIAVLCDRLGIRVWDVIDAAASKPFAFMAHDPGPGIGGDCVPVSPRYLQASALEHGLGSELIPAGFRATHAMPDHVVDRCAAELGIDPRNLSGVRILVVGLAYKPGVADTRHSPAVPVIRILLQRGAEVAVLDPLVGEICVDGLRFESIDVGGEFPSGAAGADAAIVITPHPSIDYEALGSRIGLILDTRNALATGYPVSGRVVPL